MKGYVIDCTGFSDEKKTLVQKAFFKMGIEWGYGRDSIKYLDSDKYTTVDSEGQINDHLMYGSGIYEKQKQYLISFNDLMKEAGMEEHIEKEELTADTKVSVELTVKELLCATAVLGECVNHTTSAHYYRLEEKVRELGLDDLLNTLMIYRVHESTYLDMAAEVDIKDFFKPKETPNQKKARELREQAEQMLVKAKELEENV